MRLYFYPFIILATVFLSSCSRFDSNELYWMEGYWLDSEKNYYEQWKYDQHKNLIGFAYQLEDGDTLFTKQLAIAQVGYSLTYITQVSNQNNGNAVSFGAREANGSSALFANNLHDFPQRIHYNLLGKNKIQTVVSSLDGKKVITFNFKKINK
ncbi:MAG: hypothetical protein ACI8ZO_000224 [Flavobacteriales bacterium]|jgi:hypothetical protein